MDHSFGDESRHAPAERPYYYPDQIQKIPSACFVETLEREKADEDWGKTVTNEQNHVLQEVGPPHHCARNPAEEKEDPRQNRFQQRGSPLKNLLPPTLFPSPAFFISSPPVSPCKNQGIANNDAALAAMIGAEIESK